MLRFKNSDSYSIAIKSHGSRMLDVMTTLCEEILDEDVCDGLPAELKKHGIETTAERCRNQSAVIVGHYADELKRECFKLAQEVSDGKDPKIVTQNLNEFHVDLVRKMETELENEFGRYSGRYHDALRELTSMCMNLSPSEVFQESRDRRDDSLNSLFEDRRVSTWGEVFENDVWATQAAFLHEIETGLPHLVYDALRRSNGDLDKALDIVLMIVHDDFFFDVLANEMRATAIDQLEPNDDLAALLGTVDDVVADHFHRMRGVIRVRAKAIAEPMLAEFKAE